MNTATPNSPTYTPNLTTAMINWNRHGVDLNAWGIILHTFWLTCEVNSLVLRSRAKDYEFINDIDGLHTSTVPACFLAWPCSQLCTYDACQSGSGSKWVFSLLQPLLLLLFSFKCSYCRQTGLFSLFYGALSCEAVVNTHLLYVHASWVGVVC